jgi:transcriptional regulator with XRE-family HTH domain
MHGGFGGLLRAWRVARGHSQLALSLNTGVSSRHLSYLETGRANPSREMVLRLARALDLPLRDRNVFLQAAGFAAIYHATPLETHAMAPVRSAIRLLLRATEPNPTFVVNRRYDLLDANATVRWLLAMFTNDLALFTPPYNMARLLVSAAGMRPYVENWEKRGRQGAGAHSTRNWWPPRARSGR